MTTLTSSCTPMTLSPLAKASVLVTGADGFIGSHLVEQLVIAGARVTALSQYNSFNNWGWIEELTPSSSLTVVAGDIRDPHFCETLVAGHEFLFHLAALIAIPYSYSAPSHYVDTNVLGTLNLCQAVRRASTLKCFVHTSTSEVYGTAQYVPIDERHPLRPQSPYAATKIAADALVLSFCLSFDIPAVIARPFNTYGPRQSARAIIPAIITQLAAGNTTLCLGDLTPRRDFTFVHDTCRALMAIATLPTPPGETYNIGSNRDVSIADLADMIAHLMGVEITVTQDAKRRRPQRSEVMHLRCNADKLQQATGFRPLVTLEEGLTNTIAWFRSPQNLRRYKQIYNV